MVDINSNFQPVGTRGFISALGQSGRSGIPIKGESLRYGRNKEVKIGDSTKTNVILKNESGTLKIRNNDNTADVSIRCASIKDSNDKDVLVINAGSGGADVTEHVTMINSATGGAVFPTVSVSGEDTNQSLALKGKGTGSVYLQSTANTSYIQMLESGGGVIMAFSPYDRTFQMYGSATDIAKFEVETDAELKIYNLDVESDTTGADISISASDNLNLGAGSGSIKLSGDGTGQNGATFDLGTQFGLLSSGGGSYLTHTATATSVGYKIDSNLSGTSASNGTGLQIDFDRTVPGSGTANHIDTGIDLDVNSASLGNTTIYGMDIDVVGATSGTSTAIGISVDADGADSNIGLLINTAGKHIWMQADADATNDYATIAVADTGDLTIATVGNGTTDSDLVLDVDGDIEINAAGGDINFKNGSVMLASITAGRFDTHYDASNYTRIATTSGGVCTIATIGGTPANADLIVDAGGDITLDSGTGIFIAKNAGTEFSVANSAYAGMILGYRTDANDGARHTYTLTTSLVTIDANATVRFIAPPSGVVEVEMEVLFDGPSGGILVLGLSDNATYNTIGAKHEDAVGMVDESDQMLITKKWVVTGLTPGDTINYWIGAKKVSGIGGTLVWGGTGSGHYGPLIIKVTALPIAVSDFAVYG